MPKGKDHVDTLSPQSLSQIANEKQIDIYRDTPVRLLGYANEVGESFRSLIHVKYVHLSYAAATLYCLADTVDKSVRSYNASGNTKKTLITSGDTLIWQLLASVIVPGFTINRVCAISNTLLKHADVLTKKSRLRLLPFIGLSTIPFIIRPIDNMVDYFMDETYRKYIG